MTVRLIKGSSYTLPSPTFCASDGETPTDATGTPTCTLTREDGTALTAATVTAAAGDGDYTAAITTTHTSQLDQLTVTWTATVDGQTQVFTDLIDVVGGHYVTIPELRAMPSMDNQKITVDLLREMRDEFEARVESVCSTAFVRRYQRDRLDGNGCSHLRLSKLNPRTVIGVKINGTTISETFDLYDRGTIVRRGDVWTAPDSTNGYRNCAIAYEYGTDAPPPQLRREALKTIRLMVLEQIAREGGGLPSQTISQTFDGQTFRYSTPDPTNGRPTGIVSLDPILVDLMPPVML